MLTVFIIVTDSIICDVNITQNYVVGLFLECAVVLLVAAVLLVVTQKRVKYSLTSPEEDDTCGKPYSLV